MFHWSRSEDPSSGRLRIEFGFDFAGYLRPTLKSELAADQITNAGSHIRSWPDFYRRLLLFFLLQCPVYRRRSLGPGLGMMRRGQDGKGPG